MTYPTASINGGPNRAVSEIDKPPNIIDIRIRTIRKHGPSARKPEPVLFVSDPILNRFLHRQFLVRHVSVPRQISARRPCKRVLVADRRRNSALQPLLLLLRAVSFPVYQPLPAEPQRSLGVLARRVLAVPRIASEKSFSGLVPCLAAAAVFEAMVG